MDMYGKMAGLLQSLICSFCFLFKFVICFAATALLTKTFFSKRVHKYQYCQLFRDILSQVRHVGMFENPLLNVLRVNFGIVAMPTGFYLYFQGGNSEN